MLPKIRLTIWNNLFIDFILTSIGSNVGIILNLTNIIPDIFFLGDFNKYFS